MTLSLVVLSCLLTAKSFQSKNRGPAVSANPPELPKGAASSPDSTYTACYFRDSNGKVSWQWGLKSDNQWYSLSGQWIKTEFTKLEKFETTESYASIYDSCENSKNYYKVSADLFAIFAANKGAGYNYPIVVGGGELFPLY